MTVYRVRWGVGVASALPAAVIVLVVPTVVVRPVLVGLALGVVLALGITALTLARVRRRMLTVTDQGLRVQRDRYGLDAPWSAVVGVRRRRVGVLPVDELRLSDATVLAQDSRGRPSTLPAALTGHPATRHIQVSFYDPRWRTGEIGDRLRRRGLLD